MLGRFNEGIQNGLTKLPLGYFSGLYPLPSRRMVAPSFSALAINSSIRFWLSGLMTGPRSAPSSNPPLTFRALARSTISGSQSRVSPTVTTVLSAMQRWPAAPKAAPTIAFRVWFLLLSGRTAAWFLAPRLACTRLPLAEPRV